MCIPECHKFNRTLKMVVEECGCCDIEVLDWEAGEDFHCWYLGNANLFHQPERNKRDASKS